MIKISLNNNLTGQSSSFEVSEGCTVGQLFADRNPSRDIGQSRLSVNSVTVDANYRLKAGDRVSFAPVKVDAGV